MAFTNEQQQALKAKLRYRHVKMRANNGTPISYVDGWHVIARLRLLGPADSVTPLSMEGDTAWRDDLFLYGEGARHRACRRCHDRSRGHRNRDRQIKCG